MNHRNIRQRVWEIVEPHSAGDLHSRLFDVLIITLILLNVTAVILESVASVQSAYGDFLRWFEIASVAVFTIEYVLRLWSVTADPQYAEPLRGRLRFAVKPLPLIDLLAILPYYLMLAGIDLRVIRALRIMRLLRIAKLGRYYRALRIMSRVIRGQKEELILTISVMLILLVISSALMYHAENTAQPENFPDIPSTMWWSIVTLTTVGYGDVYPVTGIGKALAAIIAVFGIGMVALPAGIIGSGFVEEIQRKDMVDGSCCPHCGKPIDHPPEKD